jgi:hypothetical protein
MHMVTSIDNVIFTLLHQTQSVQVNVFRLATKHKTSTASYVQRPTLYPGHTSQYEVFCASTNLAVLQLGIA